MDRQERENKELADLRYDVWRAGGNPDLVDKERFQDRYEGSYKYGDEHILRAELNRQRPQSQIQPEEYYE
jgi:hypothetical protein